MRTVKTDESPTPRRSFPLRLAKSLKETASALATKDGVSLNHFISLAVAEKISRMEHERASGASRKGGGRLE